MNPIRARSQDQLHIHIGCLRGAVRDALARQAQQIGAGWSQVTIGDWHYQAMRVMGSGLGAANPFELLVAGMDLPEGPGFVLLAGTQVPGAELMLDSGCALATAAW